MPIAGAAWMLLLRADDKNSKIIGLITTLGTFALSIALWVVFDPETSHFQLQEFQPWFGQYNINYKLGVDGISLFMVLLTTFLMPICILCSWESITTRVREFVIMFLVLEAFVIGVFCSLDLVLFYIFFEGMLIPMYVIIGIWGGKERIYASYKFFLYTLLGSVLFLLAILYIYGKQQTTDIPELMKTVPHYTLAVQRWLWLAMLASFAVKVPMWPIHTWLPDAHVQAPTAGSVILAGILLKMGASDAGGYEKADCLFFSSAYGLRHCRYFCFQYPGYRRFHYSDDKPRPRVRRIILMCRCSV
jgi:NADH-quinone oxidoreductase subunit M